MLVGIYSYYDVFNKKNAIFDKEKYPIGENLEYPFYCLKDELNKMEIEICTLDNYEIEKFDKILFLDYPTGKELFLESCIEKGIKLYLVILESEIVKKDNWDKDNHKIFEKIFIWNKEFVDNKKYIHLNLANKIPEKFKVNIEKKEKFCCLISGNKFNDDPRELYSERIKAIEWFEKNHLEKFDLYGMGWRKPSTSILFNTIEKITKILRTILKKRTKGIYKSYKGKIESKKEVLEKYKYSICYENAKNINGYITEKIFDCFFSGVIPIYLGPENIDEVIPVDTFIDKRKFSSYDELYSYIENIDEKKYNNYINSIENFVNGKEIIAFSAEKFAKIVIKNLID